MNKSIYRSDDFFLVCGCIILAILIIIFSFPINSAFFETEKTYPTSKMVHIVVEPSPALEHSPVVKHFCNQKIAVQAIVDYKARLARYLSSQQLYMLEKKGFFERIKEISINACLSGAWDRKHGVRAGTPSVLPGENMSTNVVVRDDESVYTDGLLIIGGAWLAGYSL